jgi:hypothetical protein
MLQGPIHPEELYIMSQKNNASVVVAEYFHHYTYQIDLGTRLILRAPFLQMQRFLFEEPDPKLHYFHLPLQSLKSL